MGWEAECFHLSVSHITRNKKIYEKKKLKQTNVSAHLVQYRSKIREGSPNETMKTTKERICERDEF